LRTYSVRTNAAQGETRFLLDDGMLIEQRPGRPERRLLLADLKAVRIVSAPLGYGRRRHGLALTFAKHRSAISSHGVEGIARLKDQTPTFTAFCRALITEAALAAPHARFTRESNNPFSGMDWIIGLLGLGVLALMAASASAGAIALGADLSARLAFVMLLMLALRPWIGDSRAQSFDPRNMPHEVLP